jgi:non-canonical (house-cleaning) NTP pyrophosphatase
MGVIHNRDCAPLVRFVTIVVYYMACECSGSNVIALQVETFVVAACDPETLMSSASPNVELPQDILFDDARKSFCDILAAHNHRDGPRVVALLRCLTNHKILREQILTQDVLEALMKFFDAIINRRTESFGQVMDGLNYLLQCGALVIIVYA